MIQTALKLEILQLFAFQARWSDWTDKEGFHHKVRRFCILHKNFKVIKSLLLVIFSKNVFLKPDPLLREPLYSCASTFGWPLSSLHPLGVNIPYRWRLGSQLSLSWKLAPSLYFFSVFFLVLQKYWTMSNLEVFSSIQVNLMRCFPSKYGFLSVFT